MTHGEDWAWTVAPATRCPACDTLSEPGSVFCGRCGHQLRAGEPSAGAVPVTDLAHDAVLTADPATFWAARPARPPLSAAHLVLAAGWALGGVMALVAPFLALFTVRIDGFRQEVSYDVTGWGEIRGLRGTDALHGHEPRLGVLLVGVAAVVLVAAAGLVLRAGSRRPLVVGSTGSALAVIVLVVLVLAAESNASYSDLSQTHSAGSGLWLAVTAGLVLALTGASAVGLLRAGRTPSSG